MSRIMELGVATATPTRSNLTKLGSSGPNRIRFSPRDVVQPICVVKRHKADSFSLPAAAPAKGGSDCTLTGVAGCLPRPSFVRGIRYAARALRQVHHYQDILLPLPATEGILTNQVVYPEGQSKGSYTVGKHGSVAAWQDCWLGASER